MRLKARRDWKTVVDFPGASRDRERLGARAVGLPEINHRVDGGARQTLRAGEMSSRALDLRRHRSESRNLLHVAFHATFGFLRRPAFKRRRRGLGGRRGVRAERGGDSARPTSPRRSAGPEGRPVDVDGDGRGAPYRPARRGKQLGTERRGIDSENVRGRNGSAILEGRFSVLSERFSRRRRRRRRSGRRVDVEIEIRRPQGTSRAQRRLVLGRRLSRVYARYPVALARVAFSRLGRSVRGKSDIARLDDAPRDDDPVRRFLFEPSDDLKLQSHRVLSLETFRGRVRVPLVRVRELRDVDNSLGDGSSSRAVLDLGSKHLPSERHIVLLSIQRDVQDEVRAEAIAGPTRVAVLHLDGSGASRLDVASAPARLWSEGGRGQRVSDGDPFARNRLRVARDVFGSALWCARKREETARTSWRTAVSTPRGIPEMLSTVKSNLRCAWGTRGDGQNDDARGASVASVGTEERWMCRKWRSTRQRRAGIATHLYFRGSVFPPRSVREKPANISRGRRGTLLPHSARDALHQCR